MPKKLQGFDVVLDAARTLPGAEQSTTWGTDALKVHGRLLACRAIHKSAEPNSIVVKIPVDQREELIAARRLLPHRTLRELPKRTGSVVED